MRRQKLWRVRVRRSIEDWIDVSADTPQQAEEQAAVLPGVISVFGNSAMDGSKPVGQVVTAAIEDNDGD